MKKTDYPFYIIFVFLLVLIIVMLIIARPLTFFAKQRINKDTAYILQTFEINKRLAEYWKMNGNFPKNLHYVSALSIDSLEKIYEYTPEFDDYTLRTLVPVNDTILIINRKSIQKEAYEEQDMGGN